MISVIVAVYNGEQYIEEALQSILSQTGVDLEVIIVDDGSNDDSLKLCKEIATRDRRVKVFFQQNQGVSAARNFGLKYISGEYVSFMDQDDFMVEDTFQEHLKLMEQEGLDFIKFARQDMVVRDGKLKKKICYNNFSSVLVDQNTLHEHYFILRENLQLSSIWNGIYRKSFLDANGIRFDASMTGGCEDQWFNSLLVNGNFRGYFSNQIGYHHLIRFGISTSTKFRENQLDSMICLCHREMELADRIRLTSQEKKHIFLEYLHRFVGILTKYSGNKKATYATQYLKALFEACQMERYTADLTFMNTKIGSFADRIIFSLFVHKYLQILGNLVAWMNAVRSAKLWRY